MLKLRRAVFLDRDGVLIRTHIIEGKPIAICDGDVPEILNGVQQACSQLRDAGFLLVMVTNQPDVSKGATSREFVENTNQMLVDTLGLDDSRVCYHLDSENCQCRKPRPGLLWHSAEVLRIDLARSFMVGDRWRDVDAGHQAGCRTIYLDYGYREKLRQQPEKVCNSLPEAARWILAQ